MDAKDLTARLRARQDRLLACPWNTYATTLRSTRDFIRGDFTCQAILAEAAATEPNLDAVGWARRSMDFNFMDGWPHQTDSGQAAVAWTIMDAVVDDQLPLMDLGRSVGDQAAPNNGVVRQLTDFMFVPLFTFLIDRVAEQSSVLHALYRYVRRLEWFDRDELSSQAAKDTQKAEVVFDHHLRMSLYDDGIDMPYSQSSGPSGESDLVAQIGGDDPLVCELKLFDNVSKDKAYVAKGLHQAIEYAGDYGLGLAYLVVVNLTGRPVEMPTDGPEGTWPHYLDVGGVRVFLVVGRGTRLASASKLGKPAPITFARSDLVTPPI